MYCVRRSWRAKVATMSHFITKEQLERFKAQLDAMYQHFLEHSDACEAGGDITSSCGLNWALGARALVAQLYEHLSR